MQHDEFNPATYFEEIGAWSGGSRVALSYVIGFVGSFALTIVPLWLIYIHNTSGHAVFMHPFLIGAAVCAALVQFVLQAVCFLHVRPDAEGRERFWFFVAALAIVVVFVGGSLWIMNNLNSRMMPGMTAPQMDDYMNDQNGGI